MESSQSQNSSRPYGLLEAIGIELEYMIVDQETLDVKPVADRILRDPSGRIVNELERGPISWSNELVAHVLEFKCSEPVSHLRGLADSFFESIRSAGDSLNRENVLLLPGSVHPWMDPSRETVLWSHENHDIYETYHRLFNCYRHGWSNLQSMHINLSFRNEEEFLLLHRAIRLVLPLIPALAASSPVLDGTFSGRQDERLQVYRNNQSAIPEIAGLIIPEDVTGEKEYDRKIYEPVRRAIGPLDPEGILEDVWLNSREPSPALIGEALKFDWPTSRKIPTRILASPAF